MVSFGLHRSGHVAYKLSPLGQQIGVFEGVVQCRACICDSFFQDRHGFQTAKFQILIIGLQSHKTALGQLCHGYGVIRHISIPR